MNPLERALLEKAGHDNGFENVLDASQDSIAMGSARHPAQVTVRQGDGVWVLTFEAPFRRVLVAELARSMPEVPRLESGFLALDRDALASVLRRAAALARALPNQAEHAYADALAASLDQLPATLRGTEVERMVRQRVGQQTFRNAMLDYWGGACAVTGLTVTEALRASHAKPWTECHSDAERLDVFNGFLLSANLDALFDRFLISFADDGVLLTSPVLSDSARDLLGLRGALRLRWIAQEHRPYLAFHRTRVAGDHRR